MLCLSRPRTWTCTHDYFDLSNTERSMSIVAIWKLKANRDEPSCPEEGEVCPLVREVVM